MTVIDFQAAKAERAAIHQVIEALARHLAKYIVTAALDEADAAFAVANPIRTSDPQMSRGVYRFGRRRLRRKLRKHLMCDENALTWYPNGIELASELYDGRLLALIEERDAGRSA